MKRSFDLDNSGCLFAQHGNDRRRPRFQVRLCRQPRINSVSVIDRATNSVVATIDGIPAPGGVAVTHDGKEVWVVAYNEVDVIDTATNHGCLHVRLK